MKRLGLAALILAGLLAGCETMLQQQGLSEVIDRPGERALLAGWRAYDDAQYPDAERHLKAALAAGLQSKRDQASAHKLLAFIYCTSNRASNCEQSFRAARSADPAFTLGKAEVGHPLWGPAYRKAMLN
jgi:Tfp pilus assembly protein PilF